jgi:hypothetical protein
MTERGGLIQGPYRCWLRDNRFDGPVRDLFRISAAHDEWNHLLIPLLALDRGLFAREGLPAVEVIATGSEDDQVAGLHEGWIDVAVDALASLTLAANARGQRVFIGAGRRQGYTFFLIGARGIERLEELRGKRLILSEPYGVTAIQSREILRRSGLEPDKDVHFVYTGVMHDNLRTRRALEAGDGEAVMQPVTVARQMEADGYPLLVDGGQFFRPRHDRIMAVSGASLDEAPESLTACFKAMIDAARIVLDRSQAESMRDLVERCGFAVRGPEHGPVFDALLESLYFRIDPLFDLPSDGLGEIMGEAQRAGALPTDYEVDRALRLDALREAQQSASRASPSGR